MGSILVPLGINFGILRDPSGLPKKERTLKAETTEIRPEMELIQDSFLDLTGSCWGSGGPLWLSLGPEAPPR